MCACHVIRHTQDFIQPGTQLTRCNGIVVHGPKCTPPTLYPIIYVHMYLYIYRLNPVFMCHCHCACHRTISTIPPSWHCWRYNKSDLFFSRSFGFGGAFIGRIRICIAQKSSEIAGCLPLIPSSILHTLHDVPITNPN